MLGVIVADLLELFFFLGVFFLKELFLQELDVALHIFEHGTDLILIVWEIIDEYGLLAFISALVPVVILTVLIFLVLFLGRLLVHVLVSSSVIDELFILICCGFPAATCRCAFASRATSCSATFGTTTGS